MFNAHGFTIVKVGHHGPWLVCRKWDGEAVASCPTENLAEHICYRCNDLSRPVIREDWPDRIRRILKTSGA